jgi:ABC-type phosphate transport system substrate-binding protein
VERSADRRRQSNLKLPDLLITVVRRSDSSGTTFVCTKHLSAISEAFAKEVGSGTTVQWPIFIAELSNWDFSVQVRDSDFVFQPAGVTQVELKPSPAPTTPQ